MLHIQNGRCVIGKDCKICNAKKMNRAERRAIKFNKNKVGA